MGARHVTTTETIKINDLLKEHLRLLKGEGQEGLCEYKEDFDDKRIAAMVASDLSQHSVARIRQECFGKLFIRGTGVDTRVKSLEDNLADITARYNRLVETLAINKVADVRHLKVLLA